MRIFETFVVALVLVLTFTLILNKKLDAGDRETAKLEEKLETALKDIDWLKKEMRKAIDRGKKLQVELNKTLETSDKELMAALKKELVPAMTKLVVPLNKRNRALAAELDNLHKYDKELAAWLKQRDKELVAALKKDLEKYDKERVGALEKELGLVAPLVVSLDNYDKELAGELAGLHDYVQRLQNDVRKDDERLSRKLTRDMDTAYSVATKFAAELCANMIVHYGRITHKHYPRPAGATIGNDAVLHEPAPRDLKSRLLSKVSPFLR